MIKKKFPINVDLYFEAGKPHSKKSINGKCKCRVMIWAAKNYCLVCGKGDKNFIPQKKYKAIEFKENWNGPFYSAQRVSKI